MGALKLSYSENHEIENYCNNSFLRVVAKDGVTITPSKNYYTFGSPMPGRTYNGTNYRYGFNSQEKDNEVYGDGNLNTAEYWEYDTRLARRWNTDPIVKPWESPYMCFADNPIWFSDVAGLSAGAGDGDKGKQTGFPSNPKDGQEYVHYNEEQNANWGYVYSAEKQTWLSTGGAANLPNVTVESTRVYSAAGKLGNSIAHFLTHSHFVFKLSGSVDVGLAAKIQVRPYNVDVSAKVSVINANLLSGSYDLAAKRDDPNAYSGSYIGKDGVVKMSQGVGISVTDYLSAEYKHSFDAVNIMSDMNSSFKNEKNDFNVTVGLPLIRRSNSSEVLKNTLTNELGGMKHDAGTLSSNGSAVISSDKSFFGIDLGVGVQVILGASANIKIGLEED